ncbi:MAG: type II 3-dehydroquinate dehydratase [Candidatus Rifleibacteriota bacterium]
MIHVVDGPNMNLLGQREPEIYGKKTLKDLRRELEDIAFCNGSEISFFQSNHEGDLIDYLQEADPEDKIILNPGALAHTSISLRDCIMAIKAVVVEVHISNIFARETFRRKSILSSACAGIITGFGTDGYKMALKWLLERE